MTLKATGDQPVKPPLKPEDQELVRKREEQAALETELAERELRSANLRAELGAFERQYLHFVGSRYAELDEYKAQIAERSCVPSSGGHATDQQEVELHVHRVLLRGFATQPDFFLSTMVDVMVSLTVNR